MARKERREEEKKEGKNFLFIVCNLKKKKKIDALHKENKKIS